MQPFVTPTSCPPHFDLDRIAFAVDALTAGFTEPLLIHVAQIPGRGTTIEFEAFPERELHTITVQPDTDAQRPWRVAGIAAPVRIRAAPPTPTVPRHGWLVHLVERGGRRATRLWQPKRIGAEPANTDGTRTDVTGRAVPLGGPIDELCCQLLDMTS